MHIPTTTTTLSLPAHCLPSPRRNIPKREKNVATDVFGETLGRIHMQREDFSKLHLSATLGLGKKRNRPEEGGEEGEGEGGEGEESASAPSAPVAAEAAAAAPARAPRVKAGTAVAAAAAAAPRAKGARAIAAAAPLALAPAPAASASPAGGKKVRFSKK